MVDAVLLTNGQSPPCDIVNLDANKGKPAELEYVVVCLQNEHAAVLRLPPPQPYAARAHTTLMDVRSLEKAQVQPTQYPYRETFRRATGRVSHL
jgi:hypothetical protein